MASMSYLPAQCLVSSRLNRFHGPPLLSVLSTSLTAPYHYAPQGAPTRSGGGMSVARTDGEKWRRARRDERDEDRAVVRPKAKRVGRFRRRPGEGPVVMVIRPRVGRVDE